MNTQGERISMEGRSDSRETEGIDSAMMKAEYEELAAFRYALRRFLRFSEEAVTAFGLTPHQHQALLAIQGYPGRDYVTVGELAEQLQTRHHSTVGLVDRLVADGLAARRHAETDRRQVYVSLTPHGIELLGRLSAAHREELQHIGPDLCLQLQRLMERQTSSLRICESQADPG